MLKVGYCIICCLFGCLLFAQKSNLSQPSALEEKINEHVKSIRHSEVLLTSFLSRMPKGADLHHHYDGSIYSEHSIDFALRDGHFSVQQGTDLIRRPTSDMDETWQTIASFSPLQFNLLKQRFLKKTSILGYHSKGKESRAEHFFNTFSYTIPIVTDSSFLSYGLSLIKEEAIANKVFYIESIIPHIETDKVVLNGNKQVYNERIVQLQNQQDAGGLHSFFDYMIQRIDRKSVELVVEKHNNRMLSAHLQAGIDDTTATFFLMRYQNWINRNVDNPVDVFLEFLTAFQSASTSDIIVGVNIVTPEHGETSMRDYWLHMQMYSYFRKKYTDIKCSLHAGELSSSLIDFSHYGNHIELAVNVALANRIGHGSAIHLERNHQSTLQRMRENNVPVEICLSSNEFILGIKGNQHPVMLYHAYGVPMVLCTDGLGVLRTNLTEQYMLLLKRYPTLSYSDIKKIARESVTYALAGQLIKEQLQRTVNLAFDSFEESVVF